MVYGSRNARVVRASPAGVTVQLNDGYTAQVKKTELAEEAVRSPEAFARSLGNTLDVQVTDVSNGKVTASRCCSAR